MYMKKLYLLFLTAIVSTSVFAQQAKFPVHAGFRVFGGGSYQFTKLDSYENFMPTYNAANASRLETPLGNLRPTTSYCWGAEGYIGFLFMNVIQNYSSASATATLKNGDSREFTLKYHPLDMNFDIMIPGKKVSFGFALGMEIQKATLYSGYRYNGGFLSYAEDQPLNGIYSFRSNTRINAGLRMDFRVWKPVWLSFRAERIGFWSKMGEGSSITGYDLIPHRDEMMGYASSGPINIDGTLHYYLPADANNANNEYVYFVGNGGHTFANTFKGWRFMLTLQFNLVDWNLDKNN
jgi:hypothetical protein